EGHYVELGLRDANVISLRPVEDKIEQGAHPELIMEHADRRTLHISELIDRISQIAIVGDPGAGKSTLLKRLCLDNVYADSRLLPVLISVREISFTGDTLMDAALRQISRYGNTDNPGYLFDAALSQGRVLFCIDGIDELDIDDPRSARAAV